MLTRLHVDNFRCLVNFDLKLDRLNLLLGENGGGKTTVFEILARVQGFLGQRSDVNVAFPPKDITAWQNLDIQSFELEFELGSDCYVYGLVIEHDRDQLRRWIKRESLTINQRVLFEFQDGQAQVYNDDFTPWPVYPFDPTKSVVGSIPTPVGVSKLATFRHEIQKLVIIRPFPPIMSSESKKEKRSINPFGDNFASWYRFLSQEHQGNILDLTQELRKVMPGFDSFSLREAGEGTRILKVLFRAGSQSGKPVPFNFHELSDGQRQLIVLYCLLYGVKGQGYSLFLDEPDNYVALREIQPWLTSLQDAVGESISQAVLISHSPEVIDYLAGSSGLWFERPDNGPTRVSDRPPAAVDGLKISETIARGLEA